MVHNTIKFSAITCALMAMAAFTGSANAAATTGNVTVGMVITVAACTVTNGNASIILTKGSAYGTTSAYMAANALTTPGTTSNTSTSSALNQTVTIACNNANTTITSILVGPGAAAKLVSASTTGYQLLVDKATVPLVAGVNQDTTGWYWAADLVSVNNSAAPFAFATSAGVAAPYTTGFNTGAIVAPATNSTATFVWRPTVNNGTGSALGLPTGGSFAGSYLLTVNY